MDDHQFTPDPGKILTRQKDIVEQSRQSRERRAEELKQKVAVVKIQALVRGYLLRNRLITRHSKQFDDAINKFNPQEQKLVPAIEIYKSARLLFSRFSLKRDSEALEKLCRYLIWSYDQEIVMYNYLSCSFPKGEIWLWIKHLKDIVSACSLSLSKLSPERQADSKVLSIYLNTIFTLTCTKGWKLLQTEAFKNLEPGMCKITKLVFKHLITDGRLYENIHTLLEASYSRPDKITLKKVNLAAINTLSVRPITEDPTNVDHLKSYSRHMLTIPAYIYYVNLIAPEALNVKMIQELCDSLQDKSILNWVIEGKNVSNVLSLLANIIDMGIHYQDLKELLFVKLEPVISGLLQIIETSENSKKSNWHPILGWVSHAIPKSFINASEAVRSQIESLWRPVFLNTFFSPLFIYLDENKSQDIIVNKRDSFSDHSSQNKGLKIKTNFYRVFKKAFSVPNSNETNALSLKFTSEVALKVSYSCNLYNHLLKIFNLCKLDILTGLCFKENSKVLISLYKLIIRLKNDAGVKGWAEILQTNGSPQESIILLFSDIMIHFITILDDQEMYEQQAIFKLDQLALLSDFVNQLCFRLIAFPSHLQVQEPIWVSLKTLLLVLYRRDCRKKFCRDDHWLIESSKVTQIMGDIDKGRKNAKRVLCDMPHVLKEESRVILFRKWASSEKTLSGSGIDNDGQYPHSSTLITIQRGRIVEDGYAQLANLSSKSLKGTIRVRFQNELGLDEAGIDQDGVFKEFLEETITAVFNPSLNLFKCTKENLLYPSPLSYLHDNHLELFEFVGKMLAKAIYEGIVVDVHFAPFFLSQILGHQHNALFSAIDELQSLDVQLYNSLNYIKHYEGNVQDLELTFSIDQDVLGEIKSSELIPGGKAVSVTNENKINYLYLMAYYHLYVQIKKQTAAFLKGFRSILPNEWIRIFSAGELQRLISGEDSELDLIDLRRNTQYYGGFHDNHRVVLWLWDILNSDFTEDERKLFLKFVTSCSKPPLLGFVNLDPPFSIRCVEVSDDEDNGDTIGSVLRGFLTIGKKDPVGRLPTSSTCFNLLKLPNYQKRSTLREKLRYSITANVGFELS